MNGERAVQTVRKLGHVALTPLCMYTSLEVAPHLQPLTFRR